MIGASLVFFPPPPPPFRTKLWTVLCTRWHVAGVLLNILDIIFFFYLYRQEILPRDDDIYEYSKQKPRQRYTNV